MQVTMRQRKRFVHFIQLACIFIIIDPPHSGLQFLLLICEPSPKITTKSQTCKPHLWWLY